MRRPHQLVKVVGAHRVRVEQPVGLLRAAALAVVVRDVEEEDVAQLGGDVRIMQQLEALCKQRAPDARWQWVDPPRSEVEVTPVQLPALEEEDLLTDPYEELQRQKALLGDDPN